MFEIVQIRKYLSNLGDSWSSLAYLGHYYYLEVCQVRLLYCHGSNHQVTGFPAYFTSVTSSKVLVASLQINKFHFPYHLLLKRVQFVPYLSYVNCWVLSITSQPRDYHSSISGSIFVNIRTGVLPGRLFAVGIVIQDNATSFCHY